MSIPDVGRILFALDACCDSSDAALECVVTIAARLDAALEGLFVEDQELMRAAGLPFACEIGGEGHERALDAVTMRASIESVSAQIARRLQQAAVARNVRWNLTTTAGSRLVAALHAAEGSDLLLAARTTRWRQPLGRESTFRRVCVFYDASQQARRALDVVRALASNGHTHDVLLVGERPPPMALLAELRSAGLRTYAQLVPERDTAAVLREAGVQGSGLLILPKPLVLAPAPAQARLIEALAMPLLLMR